MGQTKTIIAGFQLLSLICLLGAGCDVLADDDEQIKFRPFGDFRVRLEQDWDSLRGDGSKR